jgi:hypothetical protein
MTHDLTCDIWKKVEGIDTNGIVFKSELDRLLTSSVLDSEAKRDILMNFCRDGCACAAYASIPILLAEAIPTHLLWDLASTAAIVLTDGVLRKHPPVPQFLKEYVSDKYLALAVRRLKEVILMSDLSMPELIRAVGLICDLTYEPDLASDLFLLADKEEGTPLHFLDGGLIQVTEKTEESVSSQTIKVKFDLHD